MKILLSHFIRARCVFPVWLFTLIVGQIVTLSLQAKPTTHQLEQLPPPISSDEVLVFNAQRGTWESTILGEVESGSEFIHANRLFRLRGETGIIQWINDVDVAKLVDADATWDPEGEHRYPDAEDVVYVTGKDARHVILPQARNGEKFAFQGRLFEVLISNGNFSIRPTRLTINRVVETFRRKSDTLVDLKIEYVDSGITATTSGTPEHPFYVPALGDYVAMGELTSGTVLRTDDGSEARVVRTDVRHGDFEVFNFEVEHAHNYFVSPQGSDAPGVLVHNECYKPTGPLVGRRVGHTFVKHGSHNTHELQLQARGSGRPQGQWIDDVRAEQLIGDNLGKLKNGSITVEIPEGIGRVVMPDGTFVPATHARNVPSGSAPSPPLLK